MIGKRGVCLLVVLGCAVLAVRPGRAETFCVSTSAELSAALLVADSNGQDDSIHLVQGNYPAPSGGFYFGSSEAHGLSIGGD